LFRLVLEQKLICWSEWREETFTFIVLSTEDKTTPPRYILVSESNLAREKAVQWTMFNR